MTYSESYSILNDVPVGIFILSKDFTVVFWNKCMVQWSGMKSGVILGKDIRTIYPHFTDKKYYQRIQSIFEGGPPILLSAQLHGSIIPSMQSNGRPKVFNTRIKALNGTDKTPQALFTMEDVTALSERIQTYYHIKKELSFEIEKKIKAEKELITSKQQLLNVYNNVSNALVIFDRNNTIISCNKVNEKVFGYTPEELLGKNGALFFTPCDSKFSFFKAIRKEIEFEGSYEGELCLKTGTGSEITCKVNASSLDNKDPHEIICCFSDITKEKEAKIILEKHATFDPLTATLNRRCFMERLEQEIRIQSRYEYPMCFALCDMDNFKIVNDTYGHAMGDEVLIFFTNMLKDELRETDVIGRYGGDEFILLMPHTDIEEARIPLERVRQNMEKHYFLVSPTQSFSVTATMGVTQISTPPKKDPESIEEALKALFIKTDQALYKAKILGRNRICAE